MHRRRNSFSSAKVMFIINHNLFIRNVKWFWGKVYNKKKKRGNPMNVKYSKAVDESFK